MKGNVIGFPVLASSLEGVTNSVIGKVKSDDSAGYICVANVHMLVAAKSYAPLADAIHSAWLVVSDGMPLVWALRLQGHSPSRVAGPDLMHSLSSKLQQNDPPVYFYGGSQATAITMQEKLSELYPALNIAGIESPPMLPEKPVVDMELVQRINSSGAKIVFVGLGCPKQELWMKAHAQYISAVQIGVGAAFDFLSESKKRAPEWMQKRGLEWLFRLCSEPRRLWKRYLVTNSLFIYYFLSSCLTKKGR